jgi:hypothetical protein
MAGLVEQNKAFMVALMGGRNPQFASALASAFLRKRRAPEDFLVEPTELESKQVLASAV